MNACSDTRCRSRRFFGPQATTAGTATEQAPDNHTLYNICARKNNWLQPACRNKFLILPTMRAPKGTRHDKQTNVCLK